MSAARFGVCVNPGVSRLFLERLADVGVRPSVVVTRDPTYGERGDWRTRALSHAARAGQALARTRLGDVYARASNTWLDARRRAWTTYPTQRLRDPKAPAELGAFDLDWWLVFGFPMMRTELLDVARFGALGFHPWRLPAHRGASPLVWATLAGELDGGWTISRLDAGIDTGPIVSQGEVPLAEDDDAETALHHICALGARRFAELALSLACGSALPSFDAPTPPESYERPARTLDAPIEANLPRAELERRLRAQRAGVGAPVTREGKVLGHARSVVPVELSAWEERVLEGGRVLVGVPTADGVLALVLAR